ncbi:MAG: hypothetical protein EBU90_31445 [Proteobacteria bacterium]|nr:hypothetical protein [Pseudomonadota bacterium]
MNIYQPYTYLITHIPTGKRYYGVRFARGCHPSDLGTKYFSSSKLIKRMISEEGLDSFRFEIRRTFDDAETAINWETKVLTRLKVKSKQNWLNIGISHKEFFNDEPWNKGKTGMPPSKAQLAYWERLKGGMPWNKGKTGVQKGANKGKKFSQEWCDNLSKSKREKNAIKKANGYTIVRSDEYKAKLSTSKRAYYAYKRLQKFISTRRRNLSNLPYIDQIRV